MNKKLANLLVVVSILCMVASSAFAAAPGGYELVFEDQFGLF